MLAEQWETLMLLGLKIGLGLNWSLVDQWDFENWKAEHSKLGLSSS
jgi:hypothetical protein